jgi:hypothetical protein
VRLKRTLQHEDQIEFLRDIASDLEAVPLQDTVRKAVQKLKARIQQLQFGETNSGEEHVHQNESQVHEGASLGQHALGHEMRYQTSKTQVTAQVADPSLLTTLEHLAWGRVSGNCFPHRRCRCEHRSGHLSYPETNLAWELASLPPSYHARKLVKFHLEYLAWHHNCLHGPTFLSQCERYWQTGLCAHPLWMALYCSVLGATVFAIQNSEKSRGLVQINERLPEAHELFSDMITALYRSHFLRDLSIYSLQAIAISTEIAHNLGQSQLNATLFNSAVRIAECLGLHRIEESDSDDWEAKVERETGKRVWCQMTIQDHFAIPFTESYTISPSHVSTKLPLNADDNILVPQPEDVPTISSYVRVLSEMASLMPEMRDGLGPVKSQKSLQEQYMHILSIDRRMRETVKAFPPYFLRQDLVKEASIPWLGVARRSLAITAAEKIIMIHRPFLFRSFQIPLYDFTRRTCTAAAITILREHEALVEADDLSIWTHTAFCITAAVILSFEIYHTSHDATAESYRSTVKATRDRLISRDSDLLAQRGVALIEALLEQRSAGPELAGEVVVDFDYIAAALYPVSAVHVSQPQSLADNHTDVGNCTFGENHLPPDYMEVGFDSWFNDMFMKDTTYVD